MLILIRCRLAVHYCNIFYSSATTRYLGTDLDCTFDSKLSLSILRTFILKVNTSNDLYLRQTKDVVKGFVRIKREFNLTLGITHKGTAPKTIWSDKVLT